MSSSWVRTFSGIAVSVQNFYDRGHGLSTPADEHSAWVVDQHTVEVTHLMGIQSLEVLEVCVHAEKKMSTIRMALKIPVTIAISYHAGATMEWRHVYLAVNNTVFGMFFSFLVIIVLMYWF
ncbi:hypothetical protein Q1695_011393 [Nippostrongylus brasiliensis]|nr:hypothetical protein Q1695_011393 [Nippostrongylus brasiliensis]